MKTGKTLICEEQLFSAYNPGQFSDLAVLPFAQVLWEFLVSEPACREMCAAVSDGLPSIIPLDDKVAELFKTYQMTGFPDLERLKTMCLNMCKQIMENKGYQHIACAFLPAGHFFETAAVYRKA